MRFDINELKNEGDFNIYKEILTCFEANTPFYKIEFINAFYSSSDSLRYFVLYEDSHPIIIMPFYFREVSINKKITPYFDVSTPYGYNGPLYNTDINQKYIKYFWKEVDVWYKTNNVITEFIRFSLNGNSNHYSGQLISTLSNIKGKIINEEQQWRNFRPKVRNNIRKAQREGLSVKLYSDKIDNETIQTFYHIYINTMERKKADGHFFYPVEYFQNFINHNPENCAIGLVFYKNIAISTELVLISNDVFYSFLGGTLSAYFKLRPNDLLKFAIINWARKRNKKYYVLGGGRHHNDSLYRYKKAFFPKDDVMYYTGRKIIAPTIYNELNKNINQTNFGFSDEIIDNDFFPKYRKGKVPNKT